MYCHNCGFESNNKFCPECGTKLVEADSKVITSWKGETDIENVAKHPDVLDLIATYAVVTNRKISTDFLLDKFDLLFGSISGVSVNLLKEIVIPIYSKLGLNIKKRETCFMETSMNEVFVKVLCVIAANKKLDYKAFHQAKDGILIISAIKADFSSFGGNLTIELQQQENGIAVSIRAVTKGQLIDYGKSKKIVNQVRSKLESLDFI